MGIKKQMKKQGQATIYKIREDFITATQYQSFYTRFDQALQNINKPAFIEHEMYPTNEKKAQKYNKDMKYNKKLFTMITKEMSQDALRVCTEENAGGCSVFSEVLSCEVVGRLFGARLLKTEMEIDYVHEASKKTDFLVTIEGKKIGVSVTRAFKYRRPNASNSAIFDEFTQDDARHLLMKKLGGVVWANQNVIGNDRWQKQILHVFVPNKDVAQTLRNAYKQMRHVYKKNTIVLVSITKHMDCIYSERLNDHI